MTPIRFEGRNAQFFSTLRNRIDQYFTDNNIKPTGNWKLYLKTIVFFTTLIGLYVYLMVGHPESVALRLSICGLIGLCFAGIGFNVMHDGSHGSYSSKAWVNSLMANSLNLLGGNAIYWVEKHVVSHHSFTNIDGADEDIDVYPFLRMNSEQKRYWFHKYQHIYSVFLYTLTYFSWIFIQDFTKYYSGKVARREMKHKFNFFNHFEFWASKLVYLTIFLGIPIYFYGVGAAILGYVVMCLITGFTITIVFQLAHVVEGMDFVAHNDNGITIEKDWAAHQISTTSNFATKSKVWAWLLGGLNFQVEHHLFPKISHVHYPKLNEIVKRTCSDFNIRYQEYPSMFRAIKSHLSFLHQAGVA